MNDFVRKMMDIGAWEDKACSKTEMNNAIKAAEELYTTHKAELKLLDIPIVSQRSEQFSPKQLWTMAQKLNMSDFKQMIEEIERLNCG